MSNASSEKSNWPALAADLLGKLTNLNLDMSYEFDNLEVDLPAPAGAAPARWRVNGRLRISTKGNKSGNTGAGQSS